MQDVAAFAMPNKLVLEEETATERYAKFVAEPLDKGFGQTLGNALRRILLSSLEGVAVSSIRIDGVPHEFTAVENVLEDVTDIVLNFKKVLFQCSGDLPRKLELHASEAGPVTAGNIAIDGVTSILNPEQVLCTLDKKRELDIEIEITRGRGYRPSEENKLPEQPIGVVPIDCLFSPVGRVSYSVHSCRVGQRTDFDRLEIELWTDGRTEPAEAIKQASLILIHHLGIFAGIDGTDEDDTSSLITTAEDEEMLRKLLRNVNEMELSVRAQNCLNNANICTVGELVQRSESEMMKFRNFGQKSLNELKERLEELELHLGYELKEEVRIAFDKELEKLRSGS